jgi:acetoin utilization protein AcuB
MPIILAVNGIVETYPSKPVGPRHAQIESVEAQGNTSRDPSATDQWISAARKAYHQQATQDRPSRPAVLARDLMTSPVYTLTSDSTLGDAWNMMRQKGIRHIPVTSVDDTLVGMVSQYDLQCHMPEVILGHLPPQGSHRKLAEIMTTRVISATPTTDIRDTARIMLDERIHAVPILDGNRRLVGILSSRDLLRGIANHGPLELWT